MKSASPKKPTILIADDALMNRVMLKDMLGEGYDIIEVADGEQAVAAVQRHGTVISLILLDIVMPRMDGFDVLTIMNKRGWIHEIPVIMVTSEESTAYVNRAFELGVTDFLTRPYNPAIVRQRVHNTLVLDAKQKVLVEAVSNEIYRREKDTNLMVSILSHIVEFRNGESGLHVLHVNTMTELLLKQITAMTDKYQLSPEDIELITLASSLHDIGKIAIDDAILNKPGRLTDEEFNLMKQHTVIGSTMLDELPYARKHEPLVERAYQICRWHHERYDGRGYPDGLKGDEIPISAQVVALADVYDALTSERVYKDAYSHEKSVSMILNGECGIFNPLLMECLKQASDDIQNLLAVSSFGDRTDSEIRNAIDEALGTEGGISARKSQELLDFERLKYQFFASMSNELQFEYMVDTDMVTIDDWSDGAFHLPSAIQSPLTDKQVIRAFGEESLAAAEKWIKQATPENPIVEQDFTVIVRGKPRWFRVTARAIWTESEQPEFEGVIGKLVDVHEQHQTMKDLEYKATHDSLTGLYNSSYVKQTLSERMASRPDAQFVFMVFDLDNFKNANDTRGHLFGDQVLQFVAERVQQAVRDRDIVARVGGDEFLICMECVCDPAPLVKRVYDAIGGNYEDFEVSISMGITYGEGRDGSYEDMFRRADEALYSVKHSGRKGFAIYDVDTCSLGDAGYCSAISEIDD